MHAVEHVGDLRHAGTVQCAQHLRHQPLRQALRQVLQQVVQQVLQQALRQVLQQALRQVLQQVLQQVLRQALRQALLMFLFSVCSRCSSSLWLTSPYQGWTLRYPKAGRGVPLHRAGNRTLPL